MIWIALTLYILPVFTGLRMFDDFCGDARAILPNGRSQPDAVIILAAAALIAFWPLTMALDLIIPED